MMFAFVAKHRVIWPVAWLCKALDVSKSGFHGWLNRTPSKHSRYDDALVTTIRSSFQGSDRTYGARRVWKDVLADGWSCGLHRVERLMHKQALKGPHPRRRKLPSDSGMRVINAIAPNILDRQFHAALPNGTVRNLAWEAGFIIVP